MKSVLKNPMLLQACRLAEGGYSVLPLFEPTSSGCACGNPDCARVGKHPRTRHGVHDATSDVRIIADWWEQWPFANIGLATGLLSNVFVVDIDGPEGKKTLSALMGTADRILDQAKVRTGRGSHYYFRCEGHTIGNRPLGPGLDVRGDGGYVVGIQSRHASGKIYQHAHWGLRPNLRLVPGSIPEWLAEALGIKPKMISPSIEPLEEQLSNAYATAALADELEKLRQCRPGTRNTTLNRCAFKLGQLVGSGILDASAAEAELMATARQIGLSDSEAAATIRSGLIAGQDHPRQLIGTLKVEHPVPAATMEARDPLLEELVQLDETDAGNAQRLVRRSENILAYTPGQGFLVYDGARWRMDAQLQRIRLAVETAAGIADEAPYLERDNDRAGRARFSKASLSKGSLDRMLDVARHRLMKDDAAFDADPYLLNVKNGTINLRTGGIQPHSPGDLQTKLAPVDYNPQAECPTLLSFLDQALAGDADLTAFVQKAVGLSLTGITSEQVFFFPFGPGSTGKSTLVNIIRDMLGDYGMHTPTESLMTKQYDNGIPADVARLKGARMVTATEVNWHRQIDEAKVKAMTGGDPLTARFLHGNFFEFVPQFKLWLAANDLPGVRGTAEAFWRRVRVIPFKVKVADDVKDGDLPKKLKAEFPGILAWAVRGCLAWQREGLGIPKAVKHATEGWVRKADHLPKFCNDELINEHGNNLSAHFLIERYKAWCVQHGETPLNDSKLKAALEGLEYAHKRVTIGSVWVGVKLRVAS